MLMSILSVKYISGNILSEMHCGIIFGDETPLYPNGNNNNNNDNNKNNNNNNTKITLFIDSKK